MQLSVHAFKIILVNKCSFAVCAVCLKQKRHSIVLTVVTTYNSSSEKSKFSDSTISGVSSFSSMARTHVLFCDRRKRCVLLEVDAELQKEDNRKWCPLPQRMIIQKNWKIQENWINYLTFTVPVSGFIAETYMLSVLDVGKLYKNFALANTLRISNLSFPVLTFIPENITFNR